MRGALFGLFAIAAACGSAPMDSPACGTLNVQLERIIATMTSCRSDDDCVIVDTTACGINGHCVAAVGVGAQPQVDDVRATWAFQCAIAAQQCGVCPHALAVARCLDGACRCAGDGC